MDEAYPFVAKMLLTDDSPRLRSALKYMVYGKDSVFDADRLIDLLAAFEDFSVASKSATGDLDVGPPRPGSTFKLPAQPGKAQTADITTAGSMPNRHARNQNTAGIANARSMSHGQASTSTAYSQNGTANGTSGSARPGLRPYGSNGAGKSAAAAGTYASVDGYGSVPTANGQGSIYPASIDSRLQGRESTGLAQWDRQASRGNGAGAPGVSYGSSGRPGSGTAMQGHNGQGNMLGSERANSERANSGQLASSSSGGPWGSWGSWAPQVCIPLFQLLCLCCTGELH